MTYFPGFSWVIVSEDFGFLNVAAGGLGRVAANGVAFVEGWGVLEPDLGVGLICIRALIL